MEQPKTQTRGISATLWFQFILTLVYDAGFFLISYAVFFKGLDLVGTEKDIALYLLGILSAGLVQANGFFFNSSAGSKLKSLSQPQEGIK
jgi:hypothetical protein